MKYARLATIDYSCIIVILFCPMNSSYILNSLWVSVSIVITYAAGIFRPHNHCNAGTWDKKFVTLHVAGDQATAGSGIFFCILQHFSYMFQTPCIHRH